MDKCPVAKGGEKGPLGTRIKAESGNDDGGKNA